MMKWNEGGELIVYHLFDKKSIVSFSFKKKVLSINEYFEWYEGISRILLTRYISQYFLLIINSCYTYGIMSIYQWIYI